MEIGSGSVWASLILYRYLLLLVLGRFGHWFMINSFYFSTKKITSLSIGPNELYTNNIEALWTIMGSKGWAKGNAYNSGITKTKEGSDSLLTLKTCEFLFLFLFWTDLSFEKQKKKNYYYFSSFQIKWRLLNRETRYAFLFFSTFWFLKKKHNQK